MVWVKEETEDDESPEEKLGAITDSAKQRDFNDSEEKKGPGDQRGGNTHLGRGEGETGHEDLESTEAKVWGGAVTVGENMDAAAGGVAKGSTVVKERGVVAERGVAEEKVKIDGKNIVGVVKTAVKMYMIRENVLK